MGVEANVCRFLRHLLVCATRLWGRREDSVSNLRKTVGRSFCDVVNIAEKQIAQAFVDMRDAAWIMRYFRSLQEASSSADCVYGRVNTTAR
jgi:hypothetical protein